MPDVILAIELSSPVASVVLQQGGKFLYQGSWHADRDHSELFSYLKEALDLGVKPGLILVGSGPGSYGGVRVGLAAADGLSFVYGAKVAVVCSWEALDKGDGLDSANYYVMANARRNGWVTGCLRNGRLQGVLEIIPSADLKAWVDARKNDPVFTTESVEALKDLGLNCVIETGVPRADLLIKAWLGKTADEQEIIMGQEPAPIYVRPPHITPSKKPPWFVAS